MSIDIENGEEKYLSIPDDEDKQSFEQHHFDQDEDENSYFHDLLLYQCP